MTDLVERTRHHLTEQKDDGEQELLAEIISLRTGLIGAGLAKTKQYANKVDTGVRNLKSDAVSVRRSKTPEDTNKSLADALETIGDILFYQRKMEMYVALTVAATGMDSAKQTKLLQKISKERR
tara:strand:- start:1235 stop:1606 length:372 start_codon:yes stop_codon:yes gene_type:complete